MKLSALSLAAADSEIGLAFRLPGTNISAGPTITSAMPSSRSTVMRSPSHTTASTSVITRLNCCTGATRLVPIALVAR